MKLGNYTHVVKLHYSHLDHITLGTVLDIECQVPAFLVVVGGVKDIRSLLPTMMMTPIVADSFGYSERDAAYLTTIFIVGTFIGVVLTYVAYCIKHSV